MTRRIALGARKQDIASLIGRDGIKMLGAGIVLGIGGAFVAGRVLSALLFQVKPSDPLTFALIPLILVFVAFLACWFPARRAAKVDPMVALRHE